MDELHPAALDWGDYRLTVPQVRGMLIKPLVFGPDPAPMTGESLPGLLARTAERNSFTSLIKVMLFADIGTGRPQSLPSIQPHAADRLAFVLKIPVEEVSSRSHPRISRKGVTGDFIDFFGISLRARYREKVRRRVSPRALAISPYHRALHDLRPFSFCPETLETLIDKCPVCNKHLGWFKTRGLAFCEHCVDRDGNPLVDLRDFPQSIVQINDEAALRFVTDLVNPDPTIRARALGNVDRRLSGFATGDLFELVVKLTQAVTTPPSQHPMGLRPLITQDDFESLVPDLIARAGRALMDWSFGFQSLADTMRAEAGERPGHYGVTKELGALRLLARQRTLPEGIRDLVRNAISADMERTAHAMVVPRRRAHLHRSDLIDARTSAEMLSVSPGSLSKLAKHDDVEVLRTAGKRSLVLFSVEQIKAISAVRHDMINGVRAAGLIGLPVGAIEALADASLIQRVEGPALDLVRSRNQYRLSSLQELATAIGRVCQSGNEIEGYRCFDAVLRRLPPGGKPWVTLVQAVIDGILPVFEHEKWKGQFARLLVEEDRLLAFIETAGAIVETGGPDERLSYREAASFCGLSNSIIPWLVAAGLIETTRDFTRRITKGALLQFNHEYAHTSEIARRFGINPRSILSNLADKGIKPVFSIRDGGGHICRRADVFGGRNDVD